MAFEPQNVYKVRNLVMSPNKQAAYGTASILADAKLTKRFPFAGGIFAQIAKAYYSDKDLAGKGHKFPTIRQKVQQMITLAGTLALTDERAGLLFAWLMQADAITGAGPYTHTFTFLSSTNQAVPTSIYMEDTADLKFKIADVAVQLLKISGSASGPLQAQFNAIGCGGKVDGAMATMPVAMLSEVYMLGSDTDFLIGASGGAVSIKERLISWDVEISQELVRNDAPGGGMFGTFLKIGNQFAKLTATIQAKDVDDLDTLFANDTLREIQINTTSGAAQVNMKFPNVYVKTQRERNGDQVVYKLTVDQEEAVKVGGAEIFTAVVINNQATAYLLP